MRHFRALRLFCILGLGSGLGWAASPTLAVDREPEPPLWDGQTLELFATLPVQDEGRIKPLSTYASYRLLKFKGKRSCENLDGRKLDATAWLLDCLFYPAHAREYKIFRVEDSDVLVNIGLPFKKKRDVYSYLDIAPQREKLFSLAQQYMAIPAKQRPPLQTQMINLANNYHEFELLTEFLEFARQKIAVKATDAGALSRLFPEAREYRLSEILGQAAPLRNLLIELRGSANPKKGEAQDPEMDVMRQLLHDLDTTTSSAHGLALFPPAATSPDKEWMTPADVVERIFAQDAPVAEQTALLRVLEELALLRDDPVRFREQLTSFRDSVVQLATARGEYGKVELEATYLKADFFSRALYLFLLSFALFMIVRYLPKSIPAGRASGIALWISILAPTALLTAGIVLRCIIRSRPPVTTLYETIVFITLVVALASLAIEFFTRERLALTLGAAMGALGLFIAHKYEIEEGGDTMPSMVAVLDSNFWLSMHVTSIAIGYAASLLAAAIAHVYVFGKVLGVRKNDAPFYDSLGRTTYGVLCFGMLFCVVGTVLGGIWANESWGRFWGWDPKENGALMIVLWQLAVLHARSGGYIRDYGIAMATIFGAIVVAFSWFGVNLLGVGLHSYGFTTGAYAALMTFYGIEAAVLLIGFAGWFRLTPKSEA